MAIFQFSFTGQCWTTVFEAWQKISPCFFRVSHLYIVTVYRVRTLIQAHPKRLKIQHRLITFHHSVYMNCSPSPNATVQCIHRSLQHPINQTFVLPNLACHSSSKWAWHVNALSHLLVQPFLSERICFSFMHRHAPNAHCLNSLAWRNVKPSLGIVL